LEGHLIGFVDVLLTLLEYTTLIGFDDVWLTLLEFAISIRLKPAKTIVKVLRLAIFIIIFDNAFFILLLTFKRTVFN
jgi:hypothetical protein